MCVCVCVCLFVCLLACLLAGLCVCVLRECCGRFLLNTHSLPGTSFIIKIFGSRGFISLKGSGWLAAVWLCCSGMRDRTETKQRLADLQH